MEINPIKLYKSQYTKDYNKFNFLPFNRETNHAHIERLVDSLMKHGFLGSVIVVKTSIFGTKNGLYIIDRQHTFRALVRAGAQIEYKVIEVDRVENIIELVADLNNTTKSWCMKDYARCWAYLGRHEYVKLLNVNMETGISLSTLILIYSPIMFTNILKDFTTPTNSYKKGQLKFLDEKKSDKCVEEVCYLSNKFGIRTAHFQLAIAHYFYAVGNYKRSVIENKIASSSAILNKEIKEKADIINLLTK